MVEIAVGQSDGALLEIGVGGDDPRGFREKAADQPVDGVPLGGTRKARRNDDHHLVALPVGHRRALAAPARSHLDGRAPAIAGHIGVVVPNKGEGRGERGERIVSLRVFGNGHPAILGARALRGADPGPESADAGQRGCEDDVRRQLDAAGTLAVERGGAPTEGGTRGYGQDARSSQAPGARGPERPKRRPGRLALLVPAVSAAGPDRSAGGPAGGAVPPPDAPRSRVRLWVLGARPRTLAAAVVPVAVGTAAADAYGRTAWDRALLALAVAVALQIGTNYANDYSDGTRGTDHGRVGPLRLVGGGLAPAHAVRRAAFAAFGIAAAAGLGLAALTTVWLVPIGAVCIAAGWLYTGGPRPYGYAGLGEGFVFVFFGLVATAGTAYVQTEAVTALSLVAGAAVGALATALLVVNNLRDIAGDAAHGKRTLATRLGPSATRVFYAACMLVPFAIAAVLAALGRPWTLVTLAGGIFAVQPVRTVMRRIEGGGLVPVLQQTALAQIAIGALLAIGIVL